MAYLQYYLILCYMTLCQYLLVHILMSCNYICKYKPVPDWMRKVFSALVQWFSKCGTRTTSGTWASSSGTQRNL